MVVKNHEQLLVKLYNSIKFIFYITQVGYLFIYFLLSIIKIFKSFDSNYFYNTLLFLFS